LGQQESAGATIWRHYAARTIGDAIIAERNRPPLKR